MDVRHKNNNGVYTRRGQTREVNSRYRSPTPSTPRRFPSPKITRTPSTPTLSLPKRSQSAERKQRSAPRSPSTPVQDSCIDGHVSSRRLSTGRIPEGLWPSTMRSLSVSFQSDAISIPISKGDKPDANSDRTLKPSSNVRHKPAKNPGGPRKPTPERKRSPLKGKTASDQSENSKPVEVLNLRLVDQHRWPSRIGGKAPSSLLTRSVGLSDRPIKTSKLPSSAIGVPSPRRTPMSDCMSKHLQKSCTDADNNPLPVSRPNSIISSSTKERMALTSERVSRPPSPSKASVVPGSLSRGMVSPLRTRPSTPALPRGVSPSRVRPSSPSRQSTSSTSVLSYIADPRKGRKGVNHIEDAHQLKVLYNRYLQWRFAKSQAEGVLYVQKVVAEKKLCNVWSTLLTLWDSVTNRRITLERLRLKLKLDIVLKEQIMYLDDWALIERDHSSSLCGAIEDLQASTLRLPVTAGARVDVETLKISVCSAVDVMQAIGSTICSLLPRVEGTNYAVSELADLAARGGALLDECEAVLASTAAIQVEEESIRTHVAQLKQAFK